MKVIETNGITYIEKFDTCEEWYWGTDYVSGDLYEAEEVFRAGKRFQPNRLIFVHYPDGKVYEPIMAKENQYFGDPAFIEGEIYILLVNFDKKIIQLIQCAQDMETLTVITEIQLNEMKDCYNLRIDGSPLMITRQGGDNLFQIIWPEKVEFPIEETESFLLRKDGELIFSEWYEGTEYEESVNIREYPSGNLIRKISGSVRKMPNKQHWILR